MKVCSFLYVMAWILLLSKQSSNAAILSPHSSIYDLCPGDRVVIVCNVSGANLNWEWQMSNLILQVSYDIIAENNVEKYIPPNSPAINGLTTTLLDYHTTNPLYLTSSLEFNVSDDFVNATVVCNNERRYLAINKMPTNLRFVSFLNETNTSMATLEWESPQSASRNYTIKISSKGVSVDEVFTTSSSINITLYYNTLYTISAIYTDCSLERSTSINVTVLKCQSPTSLPGVQVISPPVVSTEGSVLLYTCNHGNEVIRARCEDNYWYPNISCVQTVACSSPFLNKDVELFNASELRFFMQNTIIFRCKEGLQPSNTVTSNCTSEGEWNPNPQEHTCEAQQQSSTQQENKGILLPTSILAAALVSVIVVAVLASLGTFIMGWKFSSYFHVRSLQAVNAAQVSKDSNSNTNLELNQMNENLVTSTSEVTTTYYDDIVIKKEHDMVTTTQNIAYGTVSVKTNE